MFEASLGYLVWEPVEKKGREEWTEEELGCFHYLTNEKHTQLRDIYSSLISDFKPHLVFSVISYWPQIWHWESSPPPLSLYEGHQSIQFWTLSLVVGVVKETACKVRQACNYSPQCLWRKKLQHSLQPSLSGKDLSGRCQPWGLPTGQRQSTCDSQLWSQNLSRWLGVPSTFLRPKGPPCLRPWGYI